MALQPEGEPAHPAAVSAEGVFSQLLGLARRDAVEDRDLPPYLAVYLAGHAAGPGAWGALAADRGVLDRLDPDRVAVEAFRPRSSASPLPVEIAAGIIARDALRDCAVESRGVLRALGVARLHRGDPSGVDPRVAWARLARVREHLTLIGHTDLVTGVCPVPMSDGRTLLATTSRDRTVRLWDPGTGTQVGDPLTGHTNGVTGVCPIPMSDGRTLLATTSRDKSVRLWDPGTGTQVGDPLTGHTNGVTGVCPVPMSDGRTLLATTSYDESVRLWDPGTGTQVGDPLTGHTNGVTGVCPIPMSDGRTLLATTSHDETVRLWDPGTGTQVGDPLTGHTSWVSGVCPIPMSDGRTLLATTSHDETVRLWDPGTGTQIGDPLTGHTGWVTGVYPVPMSDGRTLLATTSRDDKTVRLWDPATGRCLQGLTVDPSVPEACTSVDDLLLVACSDGLIAFAVGAVLSGDSGAIHEV